MKKHISFIFALLIFFPLFCDNQIKVGFLKSPDYIPLAYMMEKNKVINNIKVDYIEASDSESLLTKLLTNQIDLTFVNVNVAAKAYYSSNKSIKCCAITRNGSLYLITKEKNSKRFSDLPGKSVNIPAKDNLSDYIFRFLLEKNEIEIDKKTGVSISYSTPVEKIIPQLITDKIKYAVVTEPLASIANKKDKQIITAIDLQEEYSYFAGNDDGYPVTVMIANVDFVRDNKFFLDLILSAYQEAVSQIRKNPLYGGKMCQKYKLGLDSGIAVKAIPKMNFTYISDDLMQPRIEAILNLYSQFLPEDKIEALPDSDFYYIGLTITE